MGIDKSTEKSLILKLEENAAVKGSAIRCLRKEMPGLAKLVTKNNYFVSAVGTLGEDCINEEKDGLELVYGDEIIIAKNTLREKMRMKREWIRGKHSAEKVMFFRAYDPSGNRVPKEELYVGVYIKRRVN